MGECDCSVEDVFAYIVKLNVNVFGAIVNSWVFGDVDGTGVIGYKDFWYFVREEFRKCLFLAKYVVWLPWIGPYIRLP